MPLDTSLYPKMAEHLTALTAEDPGVAAYMLDESAPFKSHTLTADNDARAITWLSQALDDVSLPDLKAMLNSASTKGATCLDLGMNYGAQYYAMKKYCPGVIWSGVELSQQYVDKFRAGLPVGENPNTYVVSSYKDLSIFPDRSFDYVTSRSMLCHYSLQNAKIIMDEMRRVASKAIIVKLYRFSYLPVEEYILGFANMTGKGYFVYWVESDFNLYLKGKRVQKPYQNVWAIQS